MNSTEQAGPRQRRGVSPLQCVTASLGDVHPGHAAPVRTGRWRRSALPAGLSLGVPTPVPHEEWGGSLTTLDALRVLPVAPAVGFLEVWRVSS